MKTIRTITQFVDNIHKFDIKKLNKIKQLLEKNGYLVQTTRICHTGGFGEGGDLPENIMVSVGSKSFVYIKDNFDKFIESNDNLNLELANAEITLEHVDLLFRIIKHNPSKTFNFTYVFNNSNSSPYMPSANYAQDGFAIGLQPTDLTAGISDLNIWFQRLEETYAEIVELMSEYQDFLGIDSSIAPLFEGNSSLIAFVKKNFSTFEESVTTDFYTQITNFIKTKNPKPIGLCGLMIPCLEDFDLAREYEQGNFGIERNIFLSLHSGLGIDVYPIGIDESPQKILQILILLQALSNKYNKPLSARFVSDGIAKIGDKSNFQNQYLYDVMIRRL
jgi:uncharacterized protein (UPF0210 family)